MFLIEPYHITDRGESQLLLAQQGIQKNFDSKAVDHVSSASMDNTHHIICTKAKQILGMLYRQFYQQSQPGTLLKLYTSLVRPHLEYASPVWNPYN